jgi:hypothetical protein
MNDKTYLSSSNFNQLALHHAETIPEMQSMWWKKWTNSISWDEKLWLRFKEHLDIFS